jgi:UDP-N-acetylmuramyl pentapeptide phosphotransferase/UDP-N-acetylglucosamine-1-phosphate transferase
LVTGFEAGLLSLSFLVPFLFLVFGLPPYLRLLTRMGRVSEDVHKTPPTKVPEPAGPILFVGALVGELVVAVGFHSLVPVAIILGAGVAFAIGF